MDLDRMRHCPGCGRVLVDRHDSPRCPYCGYDFSVSPEQLDEGLYFTASETAVLGLLAGLEIALALVVANEASSGNPDRVALYAALGALGGAIFGGWLGPRLAYRWRKKFRLLLLSACAAGLVILVTALAGWGSTDALLGGSIALTGLIYLTARRVARHKADEGGTGSRGE